MPIADPATKGVRQKESGKKVTKKVTEASEKVTESVPKTKKSDRTPFAALLLRHPESRTPEIAAISETRESNAAFFLRFKGAMESR